MYLLSFYYIFKTGNKASYQQAGKCMEIKRQHCMRKKKNNLAQ